MVPASQRAVPMMSYVCGELLIDPVIKDPTWLMGSLLYSTRPSSTEVASIRSEIRGQDEAGQDGGG